MAKRHADNTLFSQSPAKKKTRSLCRVVDLQLESMAVYGVVSPSCTLALLSDRCRKKRHSLGISDVPQEETDADNEDCTYNSFQYWKVPLPQLDLSLLEETTERCQIKHNSIVRNALDAMET
uniref:Uncharacterized protein n=1 Tax=Hippocampus comes TaxID=109280 RepID=A0A3Q2Y8P0_HIPCM